MKQLLLIFIVLSTSAFSQTEADYKDYLVDSLRKAGVDTILVIKDDCHFCSRTYSTVGSKNESCF